MNGLNNLKINNIMQTTINNILEELHTSATRMLVLNSDNAMLISYFKDLNENIVYLKELVKLETKFNWTATENLMQKLKEIDTDLTHINIEIQVNKVITEKKPAFIKL